jgi:hypothetical protein
MAGEKNISKLITSMNPVLNPGDYVFSTINDLSKVSRDEILYEFKEAEGTTIVIEKTKADKLNIDYSYVAAWITLQVLSSLEAVGLTAIFSGELAKNNISCNVVAAYHHDHIFVHKNDANKAIKVLKELSENYK